MRSSQARCAAAAITTATPAMLAMSSAGELELWRAKTVAIETACASPETAAREIELWFPRR